EGAVTVPLVIVKLLPTSAELALNDQAPPIPLKVRILNLLEPVIAPESVSPAVVPFISTVPLLLVNVPVLLLQLPPTVSVDEGAVTVPWLMVKLFATSQSVPPNDHDPPRPLKVRLLNLPFVPAVRLPLSVSPAEVPFIITVPLLWLKVPLLL